MTDRVDVAALKAPWFRYDPHIGLEFYATEQEARDAAQESLDNYRDDAPDGWDEEVDQVVWGRVHGDVREIERRPRNEDDFHVSRDCEEIVDYALIDDPTAPSLLAEVEQLRAQVESLSEDAGKITLRAERAEAEEKRLRKEVKVRADEREAIVDILCGGDGDKPMEDSERVQSALKHVTLYNAVVYPDLRSLGSSAALAAQEPR